MDEIILIGAGGHARSCIDAIELSGQFKIVGIIEKDGSNTKENMGYPIIGTDNELGEFRKKYNYALITVGQIKSAETRSEFLSILGKKSL